jgi:hypothetical protein
MQNKRDLVFNKVIAKAHSLGIFDILGLYQDSLLSSVWLMMTFLGMRLSLKGPWQKMSWHLSTIREMRTSMARLTVFFPSMQSLTIFPQYSHSKAR